MSYRHRFVHINELLLFASREAAFKVEFLLIPRLRERVLGGCEALGVGHVHIKVGDKVRLYNQELPETELGWIMALNVFPKQRTCRYPSDDIERDPP